jgi:putative CocE/NonD family hydrolase
MRNSNNKPRTEKGSQPVYKVRVEKDVYVKMRDGIRLAFDIYRPDATGKFPALLAMSPYSKEIQALTITPQRRDSLLWYGALEAGNSEYFFSRGYVHVIADTRGTAYSDVRSM